MKANPLQILCSRRLSKYRLLVLLRLLLRQRRALRPWRLGQVRLGLE